MNQVSLLIVEATVRCDKPGWEIKGRVTRALIPAEVVDQARWRTCIIPSRRPFSIVERQASSTDDQSVTELMDFWVARHGSSEHSEIKYKNKHNTVIEPDL